MLEFFVQYIKVLGVLEFFVYLGTWCARVLCILQFFTIV